jgi:UDP-glucose 4-epimerase
MIAPDLAEHFRDRRVMITGGLGFIGSSLARELVAAGSDVLLVDSLIPEYGGKLENIAGIEKDLRVNVSDVRDAHSLRYLVQEQEILFNLAGQTSHLDSMRDPYTDLEINCRSQLSILEACRMHNPDVKIVFASTRQIYGRPQYLPVDERHPLAPIDVNGINKTAGESYHLLYGEAHGLRVSTLRLTNTYGPRMRVKDARQTFLGYWFRLILNDEEIVIFGDGMQRRDLTYVDDAVRAFLLVGAHDDANGQVYNLGGEEVVSLVGLANMLIGLNAGEGIGSSLFPRTERRSTSVTTSAISRSYASTWGGSRRSRSKKDSRGRSSSTGTMGTGTGTTRVDRPVPRSHTRGQGDSRRARRCDQRSTGGRALRPRPFCRGVRERVLDVLR